MMIICQALHNHFFASHLPEAGYDIRTIQELLRYKDVPTTMITPAPFNKRAHGVRSHVDALLASLYRLYKPKVSYSD